MLKRNEDFQSVERFYAKEGNLDYYLKYDKEHAPRLDFIVDHFHLDLDMGLKLLDVGCGAGNVFSRLNAHNILVGVDGASSALPKLVPFERYKKDLNLPFFVEPEFDAAFCFETLEHLENPYSCLKCIKDVVKKNGAIFLSIPDERMEHNVIYPSLMFPHTNFEQFLEQMALPIEEAVLYDGYWPSRIWKCRNADWTESKMKYPKAEAKFRGKTPVEYTNL